MSSKQTYIQQIHKDCAGEIVAMADNNHHLVLVCKRCQGIWEIGGPFGKFPAIRPAEWIDCDSTRATT